MTTLMTTPMAMMRLMGILMGTLIMIPVITVTNPWIIPLFGLYLAPECPSGNCLSWPASPPADFVTASSARPKRPDRSSLAVMQLI